MKKKYALMMVFFLVALDQISKIYIKTNFALYDGVEITDWFRIYFIENNGAAWGVEIPGEYGKIILVGFRILAIVVIGMWLSNAIKAQADKTLIYSIILILSGAIGNTIDSVFYGLLFNSSWGQVATLFSSEPYAGLFYGKVVDMLHFPLINTTLPQWIPLWGGKTFTFFDPVFNLADVWVSTAVGVLIVFHKKAFSKEVGIF